MLRMSIVHRCVDVKVSEWGSGIIFSFHFSCEAAFSLYTLWMIILYISFLFLNTPSWIRSHCREPLPLFQIIVRLLCWKDPRAPLISALFDNTGSHSRESTRWLPFYKWDLHSSIADSAEYKAQSLSIWLPAQGVIEKPHFVYLPYFVSTWLDTWDPLLPHTVPTLMLYWVWLLCGSLIPPWPHSYHIFNMHVDHVARCKFEKGIQ